jgi:hypothetical protein
VVVSLAGQWDVTSHVDGKTVWALVPLAAPTPGPSGAWQRHGHGEAAAGLARQHRTPGRDVRGSLTTSG